MYSAKLMNLGQCISRPADQTCRLLGLPGKITLSALLPGSHVRKCIAFRWNVASRHVFSSSSSLILKSSSSSPFVLLLCVYPGKPPNYKRIHANLYKRTLHVYLLNTPMTFIFTFFLIEINPGKATIKQWFTDIATNLW